jgi:hypothetical protein
MAESPRRFPTPWHADPMRPNQVEVHGEYQMALKARDFARTRASTRKMQVVGFGTDNLVTCWWSNADGTTGSSDFPPEALVPFASVDDLAEKKQHAQLATSGTEDGTSQEMLRRDIETLLESVRLDWQELAQRSLTTDQMQAVRKHIDSCHRELRDLISRRDRQTA